MKICPICKNGIERESPKAIYCSSACKYKSYRLRNSEKIEEYYKKYNKTEKAKIAQKKYAKTEKAKLRYKKYADKYPEKIKEKSRRWYYERGGKEINDKWKENNPTFFKNYRINHKEDMKRYRQRYEKSWKGKTLSRIKNYAKQTLSKKIGSHHELIKTIHLQKNKCPLCGCEYKGKEDIHLGHIFPKMKYPALAADVGNLHPICSKCNFKMKDVHFMDYCIKHKLQIPDKVLSYVDKQRTLLGFK